MSFSDLCTGFFNAFFHRYRDPFKQLLQLQLLLLRHHDISEFEWLLYQLLLHHDCPTSWK